VPRWRSGLRDRVIGLREMGPYRKMLPTVLKPFGAVGQRDERCPR